MSVRINIEGQSFSRLTVLSRADNRGGQSMWNCLCECGNTKVVESYGLRKGKTRSCGCLSREVAVKSNTTHGMCGTSIYGTWASMLERCSNTSAKAYKNYGGRGISVCPEWYEFELFYADMGDRPTPKHQIDRIDNNAGYSKENCHWATSIENLRNQRKSKWWWVDGIRYESASHATKMTGITEAAIRWRINSNTPGYSSEMKYIKVANGQ